MKTNELLAKYPLATEVVRKSYFDKMIASVESAKDIPEEFKQSLMNEAITDERLIIFIDSQPRTLFDVFDEHDLSINIIRTPNSTEEWEWEIMQASVENSICKSRKEAEVFAIKAAFKELETKLTPIELPKLEE
jgi:uncharacterized protein VirK/YbjX